MKEENKILKDKFEDSLIFLEAFAALEDDHGVADNNSNDNSGLNGNSVANNIN